MLVFHIESRASPSHSLKNAKEAALRLVDCLVSYIVDVSLVCVVATANHCHCGKRRHTAILVYTYEGVAVVTFTFHSRTGSVGIKVYASMKWRHPIRI